MSEKQIQEMDFNQTCDNDKEKTMKQSMLLCCKVYISETRNEAALDLIEQAVKLDGEAVIANKFKDEYYNRVRYDIVSYVDRDSLGCPIYTPLQQSVVAMAEAAYGAINLESHSGSHPRVGVVDEIACHPLAQASLDEAAWLAKTIASDIGNKLQVPVYLFGAAHPEGRALDAIRRELGYYRPNCMENLWAGWAQPEILPEKPDQGPESVSRDRGVAMVGARPWISTYNVPIKSSDVSAARRIALKVSARGGGLPTVQTLGLGHGEDSTEIACILLEPNQIGADQVQKQVELLAAGEGLDAENGYFTDVPPEMVIDRYIKSISNDSS